jgi:mono/diheme cytochrome c family protein
LFLSFAFVANAADGKALFKQNCGVCHTTTQQKMVGPGLEGITTKRSEEWLIKWIKDSQALIKSGDADAIKAFEDGGKVAMTSFTHLSDDEVKSILSYIATPASTPVAQNVPAADGKPATEPKYVLSTEAKIFIAVLILLIISLLIYLYILRVRLSRLGYAFDSRPLGDRIGTFVRVNGKLIMFMIVICIAMVMKSCISSLM